MLVEQLDLETRSKLYNHTKKVLRKYQKGILSGKITADKFADNILCNDSINNILDSQTLNEQDFKQSYIGYIEKLIHIQNENILNSKKRKNKSVPSKPTVPQKLKLKNLLSSSNYKLTMPIEYLSSNDVDNIIEYITTGSISLGNEKIYNYVSKSINN
ncbi:MAG: hypothetical protein IJ086_11350 [Clostridium sp.]|nr:hypothetical protein [Clostridium sp.]